ncbi:Carbonic anhydrase, chloroplastic [Vitis vinifera]|uniref:Carbonic anhydrase n=1 Tax=Vitis vinifera TaxID=29760 RepID=A0A438FRR1_VITVI|nr:Carbonic anhydrase, chloroplastic [Vitis vinifera]
MDMAMSSSDVAIEGPRPLLSDKEGLDDIATTKIEKLTAKLQEQEQDHEECDPFKRIKDGFIHFKIQYFDKYLDYYKQLAEGQHPKFLVFVCSDSRVSPSHVLNFRPGKAFMFQYLEVENILIIRHSRCGGTEALMSLPTDGTTSNDFIDDWVKIALPASQDEQDMVPIDDEMTFIIALMSQPTTHLKELMDQNATRLWHIPLKLP